LQQLGILNRHHSLLIAHEMTYGLNGIFPRPKAF